MPGRRKHVKKLWIVWQYHPCNYFDLPFINRFFGDGSANVTNFSGERLRALQTGRIQQYLMLALILFLAVGAILYFFVLA